jgi:hypothetical protein
VPKIRDRRRRRRSSGGAGPPIFWKQARKRSKKPRLQPLTPEAHAAALAAREAAAAHAQTLRRSWRAEDNLHRLTCVLIGEMQVQRLRMAMRACGREVTASESMG